MSANNMGFDVAYNMQAAVDAKTHIIIAADVINNPTDQGQLYAMARMDERLANNLNLLSNGK
jgi:hypothetical protein